MFIVDDEPPDEADDVVIELPVLDASILQDIKTLGRRFDLVEHHTTNFWLI